MGLWLSNLYEVFSEFSGSTPARILMLGLDAAGKTTILYKIKLNENVHTIPTIGFNVETVSPVKGVSFTVWDVGGQEKIRRLWQHYYQNTEGFVGDSGDTDLTDDVNSFAVEKSLVYIVDSNDKERLSEAKDELDGILNSDEMRGVPVVVVANKQDLPRSMSLSEVADGLGLPKMTGRIWYIHGACATTGEGIFESMKEMANLVKNNEKY